MLKNSSISIVCLVCVCLLAGCAGRHVRVERRPTVCEARMDRVPFPCGARVRELAGQTAVGVAPDQIFTSKIWEYETKLSPQALHDFYLSQTELEGWRQISVYFTASGDLFFIYQRPGRLLVIDGRQQGRRLLVRCFMGPAGKAVAG